MKAKIKKTKTNWWESEIRYFHGFTVVLLIFMVIIFLTFTALFGSMYYQTKTMNDQLQSLISSAVNQ